MATIKQIAEMVGTSNATVSRVLNYDETISVSQETRAAIFAAADKLGYKKKIIYPRIDNVVLLYWVTDQEELEDIYYQAIHTELLKQSKKMNIHLSVVTKEEGFGAIDPDVSAFIAIGWMDQKDMKQLQKICKRGVFVDSSPNEKLYDAVRPNLDSFMTQMVDYFAEKGYTKVGFLGGTDRNMDTGNPSMDIREWSFRQSATYYGFLEEKYIYISNGYTVKEGYRLGKEIVSQKDRPKALCVASDTLAIGVLQALNEAGVSIPEDIAIFSINDVNVAQYVSPPLTTMHIDVPLLCETALDLLRERVLKGGKITKTIYINGVPVFRKSC